MIFILVALVSVVSYCKAQLTWTYDSGACSGLLPCSPSQWGSVAKTCQDTGHESPVNIASASVVADLLFQGPIPETINDCKAWHQFVNYGSLFTVDIDPLECYQSLAYNDDVFLLESITFHSPAEHTLGGGHHSAEVQLLHQSNVTQKTIIVSIFLQATHAADLSGSFNPFINTFASAAKYNETMTDVVVTNATVSLNPYIDLFPVNTAQFHYFGSETTPPCGSMEWFIFEEPAKISTSELNFLRNIVAYPQLATLASNGNNNRPVYPLASRIVTYSPGGNRPTLDPTPAPSTHPTAAPTNAPTVFIQPGPYKVKVKSAMIVACLALTLTGILVLAIIGWQIYHALMEKHYVRLKSGERETALPV